MVQELARSIQEKFLQEKWTLALAESCTGGRLAAALTSLSGSSQYFLGSCVAYSETVKQNLLGVPTEQIEECTVVSEPVAKSMAAGAIASFASGWAVSTTGIAGPGGGSSDQPVGTVCFAVVGPQVEWQSTEVFPSDAGREGVMNLAVEFALKSLWSLART